MISTWKVEVIPLNYTRLFIFSFFFFFYLRALPDSNWDHPNRQLGTLPIKLRALSFNLILIFYSFIY
jgi:hypothetical protein